MKEKGLISGGMAVLSVAVISLALSCAASISRGGDYGTLTVAFGGARGLETGWPGNTLPAFGTVTVKVSASDMSTVTSTASGYAGSISVQVPAGNDRLVEVTAVPASGSGAPFFAQSYYGSTSADLTEGEKTNVSISLSLGTSKIVLPSFDTTYQGLSTLKFADSITGPAAQTVQMDYMSDESDFELDSYGRIFSDGSGIYHYTNLSDAPVQLSAATSNDLAYDASQTRLYQMYDQDGVYIYYYNVGATTPTQVDIEAPSGYDFNFAAYGSGVAAADGFLYATVMSQDVYYLGKFTVPEGSSLVVANLQQAVTLSSLGISGNLRIRDMIVKDGVLYIAVSESNMAYYVDELVSRGKVIAVSASTLGAPLWTVGGASTGFPTSANKNVQFFGPARFVGVAPKKLYLADEGFTWLESSNFPGNPTNVDRVVEVDLESHKITAVGLDGEATFFEDFSGYNVYGPTYIP